MAPAFSFGLIADVQYANKESIFADGAWKYYRSALRKLNHVVDQMNATPTLTFCLNLGDSIDGSDTTESSLHELTEVASALSSMNARVYSVIGNHCVVAGRAPLLQQLKIPDQGFYSTTIAPGWRLIVLDTTEMSLHSGFDQESIQMQQALEYQESHQGEPNVLAYNGGITREQMAWLQAELKDVKACRERCIVASHHPIGKDSGRETHHAWGHQEIEQTLNSCQNVAVVFSGHDHKGGYSMNDGVHYVVLEAVLECPEDSTAFAIVSVQDDRIHIQGYGSVTTRTLSIRPLEPDAAA